MSGEKRTVAYGEPEQFYYAFWGCETSGWKVSKEDLITVTWQGRESEDQLKFTSLGKQEKGWETGKPWGLRFYIIGGKNLKLIFTIRLLIKPIVNPLNVTVGPNRILANTKPIPRGLALKNLCQSLFSNQCLLTSQSFPSRLPAPVDLLWSMMLKTFQILTSSQPELTIFCWLCYYARNPFYEGVGFMSKYNESKRDTACIWSQEGRTLTIQTISGQGTCLGKVPLSHQHICNQNTPMVHSKWVISPEQAWWACSTGLTLCVHGEVLNSPTAKEFSILVQLVPCITYYSEEIVLKNLIGHVGGDLKRQKRETISLTLAIILGAGLPGAGTGIAALTL